MSLVTHVSKTVLRFIPIFFQFYAYGNSKKPQISVKSVLNNKKFKFHKKRQSWFGHCLVHKINKQDKHEDRLCIVLSMKFIRDKAGFGIVLSTALAKKKAAYDVKVGVRLGHFMSPYFGQV